MKRPNPSHIIVANILNLEWHAMLGRAGNGLVDSEGPWLIPQIVWQFWMGLWVRRLQTCISVTNIYVASIVKVID